jgi:hypothetical protein
MMATIVHTFSPTSTRYLQNLRHFLYIMSRFFFIKLHIANVVIIEFYFFQDLKPLRVREHFPLPWDKRYAPYLARAGFVDIALVVVRGFPVMDGPLLSALVDRWRPETHSFHLPCGEMTVNLQDTSMVLGLPLEGLPVSGIIQSVGWRYMVELHIGVDHQMLLRGMRRRRPPESTQFG